MVGNLTFLALGAFQVKHFLLNSSLCLPNFDQACSMSNGQAPYCISNNNSFLISHKNLEAQ